MNWAECLSPGRRGEVERRGEHRWEWMTCRESEPVMGLPGT